MRTAIWLVSTAIWDLSISVSGGEPRGVDTLIVLFFAFAAMDIFDFFWDKMR